MSSLEQLSNPKQAGRQADMHKTIWFYANVK